MRRQIDDATLREIDLLRRRLRYLEALWFDDIYDGTVDDADLLTDGFFDAVLSRQSIVGHLIDLNVRKDT